MNHQCRYRNIVLKLFNYFLRWVFTKRWTSPIFACNLGKRFHRQPLCQKGVWWAFFNILCLFATCPNFWGSVAAITIKFMIICEKQWSISVWKCNIVAHHYTVFCFYSCLTGPHNFIGIGFVQKFTSAFKPNDHNMHTPYMTQSLAQEKVYRSESLIFF